MLRRTIYPQQTSSWDPNVNIFPVWRIKAQHLIFPESGYFSYKSSNLKKKKRQSLKIFSLQLRAAGIKNILKKPRLINTSLTSLPEIVFMVVSSRTSEAFPLGIVAHVSNDWMQSDVVFQKTTKLHQFKVYFVLHFFSERKIFWLLLHIQRIVMMFLKMWKEWGNHAFVLKSTSCAIMKIDFLIRPCDVRAPQWISSSCVWSCSTERRKKTPLDFKVCKIILIVWVFIGWVILPKKK